MIKSATNVKQWNRIVNITFKPCFLSIEVSICQSQLNEVVDLISPFIESVLLEILYDRPVVNSGTYLGFSCKKREISVFFSLYTLVNFNLYYW